MNDYSYLLSPTASTAQYIQSKSSALASNQASGLTASAQDALPEFRQLMTMMMLGSLSSTMGSSSTTGLEQSSGTNVNSLLAPLMMSMLEKLISEQVNQTGDTTSSIPQGQPVEGILTQNSHTGHIALDFGAAEGTPVHSTMGGKVIYAGWNDQGYGNLVIVENGPYKTYYAHLSSIPVAVGQQVQAGDWIGASGNTGNSTGPHLHYEVRINGQQTDPTNFISNSGG